jgi:glycosyltransferase involved in cell wall biosynthesis
VISVIVATCERPAELEACLASLRVQSVTPERVVVVDDAPGGEARAVATRAGAVYVEGARRGLAAAHNAGLERVDTGLVAFTDDDVVVDPAWLERLAEPFADPEVACVTGRIVAFELETDAQRALEAYAGFDKGTCRRVADARDPLFPFATGAYGSGANMAFDRPWLVANGGFDAALGAGTKARGGDDLAAFFDVLCSGRRLVYEPAALVRHRHARDTAGLERTVFGYGVGLSAHLTRSILTQPRLAWRALRGLPAARAHLAAKDAPDHLRRLERRGMLVGPFAYLSSRP